MLFSITRQPDDPIAESRLSIGKGKKVNGMYIVFRGDPEQVLETLRLALVVAEKALPEGHYQDQRGRPQG